MLDFHSIDFILVALNLLILYLILRKLLFKRVTQYMENRTKAIKENIENAEKLKAEADGLKRKYEEEIKTAREEADKILNDARARANRESDSIIASARQDAEGILSRAREEIEREREQMLKEVKGQVAGLALSVASKVIESNMDTDKNRALAEKFINEAGAA